LQGLDVIFIDLPHADSQSAAVVNKRSSLKMIKKGGLAAAFQAPAEEIN